jgi:hypothetical protein
VSDQVIRPRLGRLLLTVLGAAAFTGAGIAMVSTGELPAVFIGLLSITFFGGGTAAMLAQGVRHGMSQVTLTAGGMRLRSGGTVAWTDIAAVGCTTGSGRLVWLRLHDPERYLASAPAGANRAMRRFMLPFAAVLGLLGHAALRRYAATVRSYADEVRWNRETYGWDLGLAVTWLDRSGGEFVELIERYRREAA